MSPYPSGTVVHPCTWPQKCSKRSNTANRYMHPLQRLHAHQVSESVVMCAGGLVEHRVHDARAAVWRAPIHWGEYDGAGKVRPCSIACAETIPEYTTASAQKPFLNMPPNMPPISHALSASPPVPCGLTSQQWRLKLPSQPSQSVHLPPFVPCAGMSSLSRACSPERIPV